MNLSGEGLSLSREWLSLLEEELISSENEKRQNPPSEAERLPLFYGARFDFRKSCFAEIPSARVSDFVCCLQLLHVEEFDGCAERQLAGGYGDQRVKDRSAEAAGDHGRKEDDRRGNQQHRHSGSGTDGLHALVILAVIGEP